MPRFMMIYKGEATDTADMTEDNAAAVMEKWASWMGRVGISLVDVGTPFGPGLSVIDDGGTAVPVALSGYSIIEAEDLEEAAKLTDGHPYLSDANGGFSIELYQMMPVPFDE